MSPSNFTAMTSPFAAKADEITRVVNQVRGAEDAKADVTTGLPQLEIKTNRAAIARYGLNVADVNELIESVVAGREAGQVFEGEKRFGLVVRLNQTAGKDIESIKIFS